MRLDRDRFFKTIQRMRKHLVQHQVDAWHGMIRLLRGQGQHSKQIEVVASAEGLTWSEWIDAEFRPGDYYGPKDKTNTPPDPDLTLARVGCEALYQTLKDRFSEAIEIDLVVVDKHLKLTSGKDKGWQKPVLLPRQPQHVVARVSNSTKIAPETLRGLLAQVAHARSADETRPHLTGVELECKAGTLRATTTDGHRLATATTQGLRDVTPDWTILVPSAAIDSLLVALRGCVDDSVELSMGSTALIVEGSTFAVQALAPDATMPPWRQVCPREDEGSHLVFKGKVENQSLRNAIEHAARVAHGNGANVNGIFTFDREWLTIQILAGEDTPRTTPGSVLDTVRTEVASRIEGFSITQILKTSFNLAYWQEALDSIPADAEITIQYGDDVLCPLAIRAGNATHVIMPCRL